MQGNWSLATMVLTTISNSLLSQPLEVGTEPFAYASGYSHQFAVSADGKRFAVCGYEAQNKPGHAVLKGGCVVWNIADRKRISIGKMDAGAYQVAISPNGKFVALGGDSGIVPRGMGVYEGSVELRLFDADTGKRTANLDGHVSGFGAGKLAFTPDSKYLLSLASDNMIRVWTVADHKPHAKYCFRTEAFFANDWQRWTDRPQEKAKINVIHEAKIDRVWSFDVSPDGHLLAVATGTADVPLLEPLSGKLIDRVRCDKIKKCREASFSSDGQVMIVWGWVKTEEDDGKGQHFTEVWQVRPRKLIGILENVCSQPASLSPDKRFLVASDPSGVGIWDLTTRSLRNRLLVNGEESSWTLRGTSFLPDGKSFVTLADDLGAVDNVRSIQLWSLETGKKVDQPKR